MKKFLLRQHHRFALLAAGAAGYSLSVLWRNPSPRSIPIIITLCLILLVSQHFTRKKYQERLYIYYSAIAASYATALSIFASGIFYTIVVRA
jgi:hypothetical protein